MFTNRFARQNTLATFLSILALAGSVLFLRDASISAQANNNLSDGQVAEQRMMSNLASHQLPVSIF